MRTRAELEQLAQLGLRSAERSIPEDLHVVVVVTDARGDWVGVAGNVWPKRVASILESAAGLDGES